MSYLSELSPAPGSPGPSSRKRADSVISLSSELTDPQDLDDKEKSRTSSALTDGEDEEDDDDEDIVEVNKDGSDTATTRIRELLNNPPKDPKHRWETAYVYAFIERFTTIQQDSAYAPQTIQEFETALQSGRGTVLPANTEEEWVPSLDPILKDFAERCKRGEKEAGGTGGISGKWQVWVPWWVDAQKNLGATDFSHHSWKEAIRNMRDKDDDNAFYSIPWDKKLMVLKALIDFQVCVCPETVKFINHAYHYETATEIKEKAQQKREQKQREKAEQAANAPAEAKQEEDKKDVKETAKDKGKGKETEKAKPKAAPKEKVKEEDNPLLIVPIGKDVKKHLWYRIDDSPRLYINSKPDAANQNFVAVSDTLADLESILKSLKSGPAESNGKAAKSKASDPFSKAKAAAAESSKSKPNGKEKQTKPSTKEVNENNEKKLHAYITKTVLPAVASTDETSPYENRLKAISQRRYKLIKKREKEIRDEAIAAARLADSGDANTYGGGTRSSRRLRRGNQNGNGYNESEKDDELEQAIRASERERRKRKRDAGEEDSESDEDGDERPYYGGMDLDNDEDEEDFELDPEDESQGNSRARRSTRAAAASTSTKSSRKPVIPGERRSTRVRGSRREESRESSEPEVDLKASTSRRRKPVIQSDDDDNDLEVVEEAPFNGLEEVWTKGKYTGYLTLDKKFIPAKPGDIPLYKLEKMGLPMPSLYSGHDMPANTSAESSVPGSAVPTLEMENGDTSEGSMSRNADDDDNDDDEEERDDDDDQDALVVASSRPAYKKKVISESPPPEEAEPVTVVASSSKQANNKKPRISGTGHFEIVID